MIPRCFLTVVFMLFVNYLKVSVIFFIPLAKREEWRKLVRMPLQDGMAGGHCVQESGKR